MSRRRAGSMQAGQSMSEFVVILPVLLLLALGAVQFGLLYQAKATLNLAAFEAARAGALNHGRMDAMRGGLANGLRPLFTYGPDAKQVIEGFHAAKAEAASSFVAIEIINPDPESVRYWHGNIPNVNLRYSIERTPRGLSIQDANLLKIEVSYCHPLKVAFVNRSIATLMGFGAGKFEERCLKALRLPLKAQAVVRMQTNYCPAC